MTGRKPKVSRTGSSSSTGMISARFRLPEPVSLFRIISEHLAQPV